MNRILALFIMSVVLISSSCNTLRLTGFTSEHLQPGMSKKTVLQKFGKPDKEQFYTADNGELHETLYYTSIINKGDLYYYDNILEFKNGELVSLSQGPEVKSSDKTVTIKKE